MAYIYKIVNDINDKVYIGQTRFTLEKRYNEHIKRYALNHKDTCFPLYNAMKKYGIQHFGIKLIEECSEEQLDEREKYYINYYNSYYNGYNATLGGAGRTKFQHTEILQNFQKFQTLTQTAKACNCGVETVANVLTANNIEWHRVNTPKPVCCLNKNTQKILCQYPSVHQAGLAMVKINKSSNAKSTSKHITDVCKGRRKTCCGYLWKYADDH